jgi:hypothetical protein
VSSRRIEERCYWPGADLYSEWEPVSEEIVRTRNMRDDDVKRWVREHNALNKKNGDNTRYRSVEKEDAFD